MKRGVSQKKPAPVKKSPPVEDWGQVLRTFTGHRIQEEELYRMMFREFPDVMSLKEACKILGISTKTGYKLISNGQLRALKVGRSYRVPKIYLFTYLCKDGQPPQEEEPKQGGKRRK